MISVTVRYFLCSWLDICKQAGSVDAMAELVYLVMETNVMKEAKREIARNLKLSEYVRR